MVELTAIWAQKKTLVNGFEFTWWFVLCTATNRFFDCYTGYIICFHKKGKKNRFSELAKQKKAEWKKNLKSINWNMWIYHGFDDAQTIYSIINDKKAHAEQWSAQEKGRWSNWKTTQKQTIPEA